MARLRATASSHGPTEPFCGIQALRAIPDAQKGLLYQVFRDAGIAHYAQDQRVGEAAVAIVELGQRLRIAALQARDEFRVAFRGVDSQP